MTRRLLFIFVIVVIVFSSISAINAMDNEELEYVELISQDTSDNLVVNNENDMDNTKINPNSITNSNKTTHVDAPDVVKYHKNGTNFEATLTDSNGNGIANQFLIFDIKNIKAYTLKTNENGTASLPINLRVGTYTINVIFEGNSLYDSSNDVATLKVIPSVVGKDLIKYYRNGTPYSVTIMGKDKPLAGANVSFTIPGKTYYAITNKDGVASLIINLNPGTYTIIAKNLLDDTSCTNTIRVLSTLTTNDLTKGYLDNYHFSVTVVNGSGSPSVGTKVNFTIPGKTYTKITNNQGIATLPIGLKAGTYSIITTNLNDGLKFTNTIKVLTGLNTYIKPNTSSSDDKIVATIYNSLGHTIPNLEIGVGIGGKIYVDVSDSNGIVEFIYLLDEGIYNATFIFLGDNTYKASTNTSLINILPAVSNLNTNIPFNYSFLIPNYINITSDWDVKTEYCGDYCVTEGVGGIVQLPISRFISIQVNNSWIEYTINHNKIWENNTNHGSSIFIPLDNNGLTGILIKVAMDYINITYNGFLNTTVSQVSGLFKDSNHFRPFYDSENIQVIINGKVMMNISVSDPIGYNDIGLRFQLAEGRLLIDDQFILAVPYSKFPNYDSLIFASTGEPLLFSDDMNQIYNFPSWEKVITSFNINGTNIVKPETMSQGLYGSSNINDFEVVQSFIITNTPISSRIVKYYLNQNNDIPIGGMKAVYGTFLTALSTNWMYDNMMRDLIYLYKLSSSTRDKFNVVMCGVEFGGNSYVHCPDPSMGLTLNGENSNNVLVCRLISSLLLSQIENNALKLAGIDGTSSVYELFSRILNLENFTVDFKDNYLTITLNNTNEYKIIFDLDTGLVYDLYQKDDFVYKGATSSYDCYCYHDGLTDTIENSIQINLHETAGYNFDQGLPQLSEEDLNTLKKYAVDLASEFCIGASAVGIATFISLVGEGLVLTSFLFPPLALAGVSLIIAVILKSYVDDGKFNKSIGDCLTSLAFNMAYV